MGPSRQAEDSDIVLITPKSFDVILNPLKHENLIVKSNVDNVFLK